MSQGNQIFSAEQFHVQTWPNDFSRKRDFKWNKIQKHISLKERKFSEIVHASHTNLNHSPMVLNLIYFNNTMTNSYVIVCQFWLS